MFADQLRTTLEHDDMMRYPQRMHDPDWVKTRQTLLEDHNILIVSRFTAEAMEPPEPVHIVRIDSETAYFKDLVGDFRSEARFHIADMNSLDSISTKTAAAIVDHFETIQDGLVVFHCYAGVARSATVAAAFARFRGDADAEGLIWNCKMFHPYPAIFRKLMMHVEK